MADNQLATPVADRVDDRDPGDPPPDQAASTDLVEFVEDDLLVEEVSIDGMCGVY
jgi:mycofactocin precursor